MPGHRLIACVAFLCGGFHAAHAQSPADRTAIDSLIQLVEQHRTADTTVNIDLMHRAEARFSDAVDRHDRWAEAWYALGLARLELARAGALAREGPELPIGMNNESGAEHALMRAVEADHAFAKAANALALAPTHREGDSRLRDRMTAGRLSYAVMSGQALAAAAFAEREVGSVDSAAELEERALRKGDIDSTLVLLPLARDLYRLGNTREGRARLIAAAGGRSPAAQEAYRTELRWVASPAELAAWDSLTPPERPAWISNFWSKRDVAEGRRDGARLEEHYRRIEYAMANFRITLPSSGRQSFVTMTPSLNDGYVLEDKARKSPLVNEPAAARLYVMSRTMGSEASARYYHPIQDLISDKGIIWIRHGPPTQMAHNTRGMPFEIWRYERPEGPLILYFREADFEGSAMPNELVTTLLDVSPAILNQICQLDVMLCPTTSARISFTASSTQLEQEVEREGARLGPEAMIRSANRGKAFIDLATTTDTYHRDFTRPVYATYQILGLDGASGGAPRLVVAFAIPGSDLSHEDVAGHTVYPVQFQIMAAAAHDGHRTEVDTLRQFATAALLTKGEFLNGVIEVPVPPGRYSASVVLTQADGRGAVAHLDAVVVPGSSSALGVSDLVLGRTNSGVVWNSGTTDVPLNPLNTFMAGTSAEAYFQLSGLTVGAEYTTRLQLFQSDDDSSHLPRLTITSRQTAAGPRLEVSRTLGLANIGEGRYRLDLTVTGGGAAAHATAWMTVVR